ncbi:MAG: nucleotidyltransferase domain-containing protein [Mariprofundus sp.]
MRLSDGEVKTIVHAVASRFGAQARLYLFGSRLNDALRGGDIDLFVDLPEVDDEMVRHSCQAIADIQMALGE